MVSYDVVSLFTNVPLKETIEMIIDHCYGKHAISKPLITKQIFRKLLYLCSHGLFLYKDDLYKQIDGVSMGSPLAPTIANFYLAKLETNLFDTNKDNACFPKLYLRYVDDVFAVFHDNTNHLLFLKILNHLHPSLKFPIDIFLQTLYLFLMLK